MSFKTAPFRRNLKGRDCTSSRGIFLLRIGTVWSAVGACGIKQRRRPGPTLALGQVVSNVLSAGLVAGWLGLRAYEWYSYSSRQQVVLHCSQ